MSARLLRRTPGAESSVDLDSAHRVLRRWAQAKLNEGDDFWSSGHMEGVAIAAIDVMRTTFTLLRQLELAAEVNETDRLRSNELEDRVAVLEERGVDEEHF